MRNALLGSASLFIALLCAGCLDAISPPTFVSPPTIVFNPNPNAPQAAIVRFKANKPITTAIRIKDGTWERELLFDETYNPEEGLPIIGLVPDKTHELRIFIHDSFGRLTEFAEKLEFLQKIGTFPYNQQPVHKILWAELKKCDCEDYICVN